VANDKVHKEQKESNVGDPDPDSIRMQWGPESESGSCFSCNVTWTFMEAKG